jgi:hypothetical protein
VQINTGVFGAAQRVEYLKSCRLVPGSRKLSVCCLVQPDRIWSPSGLRVPASEVDMNLTSRLSLPTLKMLAVIAINFVVLN